MDPGDQQGLKLPGESEGFLPLAQNLRIMVDLPLIHKDTAFLGDVEAKQTGVSGGAGKRRSCIRPHNPYPVSTTIHTHLGKQWICVSVGSHLWGMVKGTKEECRKVSRMKASR